MQTDLTRDILAYIENVLGVAQIGLTFVTNDYDRARLLRLRELSVDLIARLEHEDVAKVARWIAYDENYATPKIDVRAMIYDEAGRILLTRERADGLWTLPGGWCEMGESASETVIKEVAEETGLVVEPLRLVALYDKHKHDHPPEIPHAYKCFFLCRITGGALLPETNETLGCAWFDITALPQISENRNTTKQIIDLTHYVRSGAERCLFD